MRLIFAALALLGNLFLVYALLQWTRDAQRKNVRKFREGEEHGRKQAQVLNFEKYHTRERERDKRPLLLRNGA